MMAWYDEDFDVRSIMEFFTVVKWLFYTFEYCVAWNKWFWLFAKLGVYICPVADFMKVNTDAPRKHHISWPNKTHNHRDMMRNVIMWVQTT